MPLAISSLHLCSCNHKRGRTGGSMPLTHVYFHQLDSEVYLCICCVHLSYLLQHDSKVYLYIRCVHLSYLCQHDSEYLYIRCVHLSYLCQHDLKVYLCICCVHLCYLQHESKVYLYLHWVHLSYLDQHDLKVYLCICCVHLSYPHQHNLKVYLCIRCIHLSGWVCFRGGFLLYHDHKSDKSVAYDFRETAPAAATETMLDLVLDVVISPLTHLPNHVLATPTQLPSP